MDKIRFPRIEILDNNDIFSRIEIKSFPGLKSGATTSTEPDGSALLRMSGIAVIIDY